MKTKIFKIVFALAIFIGMNFFALAQDTLIIVTVPPNNTRPVFPTVLLNDTMHVIIKNTGTVALIFCTDGGGPCGNSRPYVNPGEQRDFTVADLGGVSAGTNLKVTNKNVEVMGKGEVIISKRAAAVCVPVADAWVINPDDGSEIALCPTNYSMVGIGKLDAESKLDIFTRANIPGFFLTELKCPGFPYPCLNNPYLFKVQQIDDNNNILQTYFTILNSSGRVGIGTDYIPTAFKLAVNGKIIAEEVNVKLRANWPDYVFDDSYNLMSLDNLEKFIKSNKHLPDFPTEEKIKEGGIAVGEMQTKLLQKIEELTLYQIQQDKEIKEIKRELREMKTGGNIFNHSAMNVVILGLFLSFAGIFIYRRSRNKNK